jgi:hypothetical protein
MNSSRVLLPTALLLVSVFAFLLAGCGQGTVARTPEQTAQQFVDAFSSLDWNALGSLIDPQFLKANPSFIEDSKARVSDQFGQDKVQYTGLNLSADTSGDSSTVTIIGGLVSFTDKEGKTTTGDAKDQISPVKLVKRNGNWYVDGAQFGYSPSQ